MKQDETTNELMIITEENIKDMIYEIRDQKVMLDFDLARIYGYETKNFNRQIKNNINKFPKDFMFQLTKGESAFISRCKNFTAIMQEPGIKGGRTSLPYAFTEKGIYMLMTVLRGELATQQSIALIRLFQEMKDYIVKTNNLITTNEVLKLSRQVNENTLAIEKLKESNDLTQNQLGTIMDNFINPSFYKQFVIFNGNKVEANEAYRQIYSLAKLSIIIVDDYISPKTLEHLKVTNSNIAITILSDNVAVAKISENDLEDFYSDTGIRVSLLPTNNIIHDRYILLDYKTKNELMYMCGPSEKDAGRKVGTILRVEHSDIYHNLIDSLLNQN